MHIKTIQTSNKNFILDVGMQNKNWDGGYLYNPEGLLNITECIRGRDQPKGV